MFLIRLRRYLGIGLIGAVAIVVGGLTSWRIAGILAEPQRIAYQQQVDRAEAYHKLYPQLTWHECWAMAAQR